MKNPYGDDNKLKKLTIEQGLLILILALVILNFTKKELTNIQLKKIPLIENHVSQDDFCKWSLQRMIEMKPVKETLTNDIYYFFKNTDNPLKLNQTDKIIFEKSFNENCKFIVKTMDGELKGFIFNLVTSPDRPFYYQIDNITNEVASADLNEKAAVANEGEE